MHRVYRMRNTIKRIARDVKTERPVQRGWIYAVDGDRVDVRIGTSPTVVRHVEVIGDIASLFPASEVTVVWKEDRPVVLAGGSGGTAGSGRVAGGLGAHGHTSTLDGGALPDYVAWSQVSADPQEFSFALKTDPSGKLTLKDLEVTGTLSLPAGLPGATYTFHQPVAAATWDILHHLGKYPSVTVVDSAGDQVLGDVHYVDDNHLTVTFSSEFSGIAYLN